ncbi:MAG: hypothetical protein ACREB9_00185 [Thermoplasmata archaeon]
MAYGYATPNENSVYAATSAVIGGAAGAAQVIGLTALDAQGMLGTPVLKDVLTNGQLIDVITGIAGLGLGIVGAFGKGPLKGHPAVSTALAAYGGTCLVGATVTRLATSSVGASPAAVAAVCRAKAAAAKAAPASGGRYPAGAALSEPQIGPAPARNAVLGLS